MEENRGLQGLEERVLRCDLCTMCGACSALCPYLRSWKGRMVKLHDCDLSEGRCFSYCPRTEVDLEVLHQVVFGRGYRDWEMGPVRRILMARAAEDGVRRRAQTGGVVSALVSHVLDVGLVDAALLTCREADQLPYGRICRSSKEVLECSGSSYVAGATLEALNAGPWDGEERILAVGIPCQVLALAKMKASPLQRKTPVERISIVIGLFCTWALVYGPFLNFLRERVGGEEISKLDITPPPERLLKVTTQRGVMDIPLDDIRPFIRPGCGVCLDMTSELSDISVGTVEGVEGWNTVLVRSDEGERLVSRAEASGLIEVQPLPQENAVHLREASVLKKRRGLTALKDRGELEGGYIRLPSDLIQRILPSSEEVGS